MKILITGITGFIGRNLAEYFSDQGNRIIGLTRNPQKARKIFPDKIELLPWDGKTVGDWRKAMEQVEVIINLAGANVGSRYWTESYKRQILESRVNAGKVIAKVISESHHKPRYLVQASATGYYGNRGEELLDETASRGEGFLSDVVQQWEASTREVEALGVKRIVMRLGVVLGRGGGLIKRMKLPFLLFVGGPIGNPRYWFSWIHIADIARAMQFLWKRGLTGIFNFTAPEPVRMGEFATTLGKVLKRPAFMKVPEFPLKIILGEMAEEMLFTSQRVLPRRLINEGYQFNFSTLYVALSEVFGKRELPL